MATVIERLEALAKRAKRPQFMVDEGWDFSSRWSPEKMAAHHEWESACIEFAAIVTDHEVIDDLLKLARAVAKANPQRDPRHRVSMLANDWQAIVTAAEPLFREDPS